MKKTIFNSKNLLLNAILLSFLFLFTDLLGATFFSYTVDASTSFENLNYSSNSNNFKNYRLPGQKDSKFPYKDFKSLNQEPMFEHKSDNDPRKFTVPLCDYKFSVPFDGVNPRTANLLLTYAGISFTLPSSNRGTSQTSPEDANSINQGPDQSSSEEINLHEKATYPLNEQSLGSSAWDYFPNKNPDKVIADAQLYYNQDFNDGTDSKICPNCENLVETHYMNLSSLNPIWPRMFHDECSQTQQDYYIATHLSDYEDENSQASQELKESLLQDYNKYNPLSIFSEQEKPQMIEYRKYCLFKGKINEVKNAAYEIHEVQDDGTVKTVNSSPAEYWEDQNEGAKKYLEFVTANTLAEEQFAFNKLYSLLENQDQANTYNSIYE